MSIINSTDCTTNRKNTGYNNCFLDLKLIAGYFLVHSTFKLDDDDLASASAAVAALVAAANDDNKSQRIFPVHQLKNPANNNEQKTVQTFSDGSKAVVREGMNDWSFQTTQGGLCLHKALRTHNQNGGFAIFYDKNFTLIGWQKNKGEIWGVPLQFFWAEPWVMNDGSNVTAYMSNLVFDPIYVNEALGSAKLDSTLLGVTGLLDVILTDVAFDSEAGVAEVRAALDCGNENMAVLYPGELSEPGMWVAENAETGEPVDITAVAVIGGTDKRFEFTFDTEDADYPTSGGTILLSLAAPSVLDEAGVEGYESDEIELATSASS